MDYHVTLNTYDPSQAWFTAQARDALRPFAHQAATTLGKRIDPGPRLDQALREGLAEAGFALRVVARSGGARERKPSQSYVFQNEGLATLVIEPAYQGATVRVGAESLAEAERLLGLVDDLVPRRQEPPGDVIDFRFWRLTANCGARSTNRALRCPGLGELRLNYDPAVFAELERLAGMPEPDAEGKVILWHGPPGTGKTYAVRALARRWQQELGATVEVVLDPDELFARAHYLHEVLLSGRLDEWEEDAEDGRPRRRPLRLVIIEDSAALFGDACRSTPGFARLLNLSDGIIGQGLRVVFLLTTNEQLTGIDPAITRPGRCLAVSAFGQLPVETAQAWLAERGREGRELQDPLTLSELYRLHAEGASSLRRQRPPVSEISPR